MLQRYRVRFRVEHVCAFCRQTDRVNMYSNAVQGLWSIYKGAAQPRTQPRQPSGEQGGRPLVVVQCSRKAGFFWGLLNLF